MGAAAGVVFVVSSDCCGGGGGRDVVSFVVGRRAGEEAPSGLGAYFEEYMVKCAEDGVIGI
jgi:hypothetical protein